MEKIEELIEKYDRIFENSKPNILDDPFSRGEDAGSGRVSHEIVEDLKQLKSSLPKPVEVPEFVAEWIEHVKSLQWRIEDVFSPEASNHSVTPLVEEWLTKENAELIARAWLDGYIVIKEPLYYVKFPNVETNGYDSWLMKMGDGTFELADNNDFDSMQFTEQEIKAIDDRYWAFAVPVEGEE